MLEIFLTSLFPNYFETAGLQLAELRSFRGQLRKMLSAMSKLVSTQLGYLRHCQGGEIKTSFQLNKIRMTDITGKKFKFPD